VRFQNPKNIFLVSLLLPIIFIKLIYPVFIDYYISKNGERVNCLVIGNSEVCRNKNKYVMVLFGEKSYRIGIAGKACRIDEFPMNKNIALKKMKGNDRIVLESNLYPIRLALYMVLLMLFLSVNYLLFRNYKKTRHQQL
jgi:hypothetical protein